MFANFKLRNRILLGYALPIAFLLVLGVLLYNSVLAREAIATKVKHSQNTIINASDVTNGLSKMVRNVRGQVLFPLDTRYEKSYELGWELLQNSLNNLETLLQNEAERQQLLIISAEASRFNEISKQVFNSLRNGEIEYAKTLTASLRFNDIEKAQEQILAREQNFLREIYQREQIEIRWLLTLIIVGTAFSAIGALSIGVWNAAGIGKMMRQAAEDIASASVTIVTGIEQQEHTASEQAAAVNQTTITMDELGASSQTTAQQAESAAVGVQQVLTLAQGGTETAGQTLAGMTTLKEKVNAIAAQILQLSEQTNQIGNISGLVSDLANQTNMLALNAAVEAVRAGDRGQGFTVIATEIRQLADRSRLSAERINNLVADIQKSIQSTVKVTDEGEKTVMAGMQLTKNTSVAFVGVAEAINNIAISTQQISLTAQQQALAVQQVIEAMKTINQGAEQTASSISQTKISTHKLKAAAQNLKQVL